MLQVVVADAGKRLDAVGPRPRVDPRHDAVAQGLCKGREGRRGPQLLQADGSQIAGRNFQIDANATHCEDIFGAAATYLDQDAPQLALLSEKIVGPFELDLV